ncbi:MAG: hypothetical protein DWQ04_25430 [Chloroflexi bacterium]|nr:MAG: hypothetical protein DWQ04_25430 [Chloroflexota bacterium]
MAIGLDYRLGVMDGETSVLAYQRLLPTLADESERAAVHYEIWLLDGSQDANWETAVRLYSQLYSQSPQYEFRQRYQTLTGNDLPAPPPLPTPDIVVETDENLLVLLQRVGVLI